MHEEIVKRIKSLRIENGFTKQEMAEKLNIELTAYNRLESGRANTWGKYFIEICHLFKINPSAFFLAIEMPVQSKMPVFVERERERESAKRF